jgi:hypothetical protein
VGAHLLHFDLIVHSTVSLLTNNQRWARAIFFIVRNRNSAIFKSNRNSAIPQSQFLSEFRNLRASLPQFSAYFWPWSSLKLYIFTGRCFLLLNAFKVTVAQEFRSLFFSWINPISKWFRVWIDSWKKIGGQISHATVPLRQVFGFRINRHLKKYFWLIFYNHPELRKRD